jgi:hypothetical protein
MLKKKITQKETNALTDQLKNRFELMKNVHGETDWNICSKMLQENPGALVSLFNMENTGGEPAFVGKDEKTNKLIFLDTAAETPAGRRQLCYDEAALNARKENKPTGAAVEIAKSMGISLLDENQYHHWQSILGPFDRKTSSWLLTPDSVRKEGGAIFGDYRYGRVFIYHNGAAPYYGVRGFRGILLV